MSGGNRPTGTDNKISHLAPPEVSHRSWSGEAACKGQTALFFSMSSIERDIAYALCESCPVLSNCREYAMTVRHFPTHGILAGMQVRELRILRRGQVSA